MKHINHRKLLNIKKGKIIKETIIDSNSLLIAREKMLRESETNRIFSNILLNQSINTVFQPVVSLRTGKILGHEAFSRIAVSSPFGDIEDFINYSQLNHRHSEADTLMFFTSIKNAYTVPSSTYAKLLFLNIDCTTICDEGFVESFENYLNKYLHKIKTNIVLEIKEDDIKNGCILCDKISYFRKRDVRFAVKNVGVGFGGLNFVNKLQPHFLKISRELVNNVNRDKLKYALIKGMVEVSKATEIMLIAEGIENSFELETLIELGVQYSQGFYIQKPKEHIHKIDEEVKHFIKSANSKKNAINNYSIANTYIKHLVKNTNAIKPSEKISKISEEFQNNRNLAGFCIVEDNIPLGIITSEKFNAMISGEYGFSLYNKKPISRIMDTDFLKVDYKQSVNEVTALAMEREHNKLYDFIVVTKDDKYYGTVTIKDLLIKSTELEISSARHQSPLTGLPGNVIIEQQIAYSVSNCKKFTICYIDIDNFKAYNDIYGFEKGDRIIQMLAQMLSTSFYGHFTGHIGGDDFVVVADEIYSEADFKDLTEKFEDRALEFYSEEDKKRGYIISENRQGIIDKFAMVSITCATISSEDTNIRNPEEITKLLADKKSFLKKQKRKLCKENLICS